MALDGIRSWLGLSNWDRPNLSDDENDYYSKIDKQNSASGNNPSETTTKLFYFLNFESGVEVADHEGQQPGLNLRGECTKKDCRRGRLIHKGFSNETPLKVFNMKVTNAEAKCSECKHSLLIKDCIFLNCAYEIKGEKEDGLPFQKTSEDDDNFAKTAMAVSFSNPEEQGTQWKALYIKTRPLPTPESKKIVSYVLYALGVSVVVCVAHFFWTKHQSLKAEVSH